MMTTTQATRAGMAPLTTAYRPGEEAMLAAALADLRGATVEVVTTARGPEIWRLRSEMRFPEPPQLTSTQARALMKRHQNKL